MEIKLFGKELQIMLQISREGDFVDTFIKLNKSFKLEGFLNICLGAEDNNIGKPAFISEYYADRENANYFHVTVMAADEKRFYDFLKKFCEENGISFKDPRTQYQEEVRALYKRLDELKILIEESKEQEKE